MDENILAYQELLDKIEAQMQELVDANAKCVIEINNNLKMSEEEKFNLKMSMTARLMLATSLESHLMHVHNEMTSVIIEKLLEFDKRKEKLEILKKESTEYIKSHFLAIANMTDLELAAFNNEASNIGTIDRELREVDEEKSELIAFLEKQSARDF